MGKICFVVLNFSENDRFLIAVPHVCDIYLQIQAQDIRVGNIVWLRENEEVPCDLVLIGTSDPQGLCYVEVCMQLFIFLIGIETWQVL